MSVLDHAKFFQCQQSKFPTKIRDAELLIIVVVFPFQLHATQSHPYPRIHFLECPTTSRKVRAEVIRRSSDHLVQFHDRLSIQVMFSDGECPDFGFEFQHGFRTHAPRTRRENEPQEVIPFSVGCDLRLLGTQREPEVVFKHIANKFQCLLRLLFVLTDHHEVVRVSNESIAVLMELPVKMVQDGIR